MTLRRAVLSFVAMFLLTAAAHAQVSTATVNGTVTDESKGVLPGVTVTAADLETGRRYASVTDDRGTFQIVSLPPGIYRVQAELSGFNTSEVPRLELLVGQNASINFLLKIS